MNISLPIPENGLLIDMTRDNDLFDVIFDAQGEKIRGIWLLLMYHNKIFRGDYIKNPTKLYEVDKRVSSFGFNTLLKFYGFDSVLINNDNIYDIITASIVFEENRLLDHSKNYIFKYNSQEMCLKLIKNIYLFKGSTLYESFLNKLIFILRLYGNYYFEANILKTLSIEAVEYLLKMPDLVVRSESYVYESLVKYFVHRYSNLLEDNKYFLSKFASFSCLIEWPNIEKDIKETKKIPILQENYDSSSLKVRRRYFYLSSASVAYLPLRNLIIKYSTCDEYLLELSKEEKDSLPDNLEPYWNEIFKIDEIKSKLVMMIIMIDFDTNDKTHFFETILNLYKSSKINKQKQVITKAMILFIRDINVLEVIKDTLGINIISDLFSYRDSMKSETLKCIYKFLRNTVLNDEEYKVIKKTKYNDEIIKKISSKLTYFSYPEKEYKYFLNMKVNIQPSFDGTKCGFTIRPALPEGLSLNESNGVISGVCEKIDSNEYTIKCKCLNNYEDKNNFIKYKIKIDISPLSFSSTNRNKEISIQNPLIAYKEIDAPNTYNHCYIDIKMTKGTYKISYRSLTSNSIMLGASLKDSYSGNQLYKQKSYSIYICESDCKLFGVNSYEDKDIPIRNKVGGNFTMIYDMDNGTISIIDDSEKQYLLFHDIEKPLYPFVDILEIYSSVMLMNLEIL